MSTAQPKELNPSDADRALATRTKQEILRDLDRKAATLGAEDLIDVAARIASRHPNLAGRRPYLRSFLWWQVKSGNLMRHLPGEPARIVDAAERSRAVQSQIATEAGYAILEQEFFVSKQAALALGAKGSNREKVSALRKASALLGIPRGNRYLFPSFQFDPEKQAIFEEVRQVNQLLDSANDPWGVASWWLSSNGRLGARPLDAVNTGRAEEVIAAARSLTEPLG